MLSKEQASQIADELLSQARLNKFEFLDPAGASVPLMYRCRDLRSLPNGLQVEVVRQAAKEVAKSPLFLCLLFVWVLALGAIWMVKPTLIGTKADMVMPLIVFGWLVPFALRGVLVRRTVKSIAAQLKQS